MHRILLSFLLAFSAVVAQAAVYRYVDENGNVVFGDRPVPGAQDVTPIAPPPSVKPAKPVASAPSKGVAPNAAAPPPLAKPAPALKIRYTDVLIRVPGNDEMVGNNEGIVSIDFSVVPPLRADLGHKVIALIDGVPAGKPTALSPLVVENLDRGSHTMVLAVIEPKGELLGSSKSITFHIQRITASMRGK